MPNSAAVASDTRRVGPENSVQLRVRMTYIKIVRRVTIERPERTWGASSRTSRVALITPMASLRFAKIVLISMDLPPAQPRWPDQ